MIPLAVPDLSGNEARYLQDCIASTFVSSVGPFVTRMEEMVAAAVGSAHATATSSGTAAIQLALLAVGVRRDDLVMVPSYTFIASANAVSHCGATPWLVDVTAEGWTLDADLLARTLASETVATAEGLVHARTGRRVAAVMPVHTLGIPADMDAIGAVAARYALPVVVDGAASIGCRYKGRPAGRMGAALTCFSFNGNKTVTCGGGGAVVGDDPALVGLVKHLGSTARVGADYDHDLVGYNHRMTNLEAAVGCAQMERVDALVAGKRRVARRYRDGFADLHGVAPFPEPAWCESACWFSGIVLAEPGGAARLRAALRAEGVDARPFWKPVHLQAPYKDAPRTRQTVAEATWQRVVTLPCSSSLSEAEQDVVIGLVTGLLS